MALPLSNYTQIPNEILDQIHKLTDPELRLISVMCRLTLGWHDLRVQVGYAALTHLAGLSRDGVRIGMARLIERKWIKKVASESNLEASVYMIQIGEGGMLPESIGYALKTDRGMLPKSTPILVNKEVNKQEVPPIPPKGGGCASRDESVSMNPEEGFDSFWREYPKKKSKPEAMKAWKQVHGHDHLESILEALTWQRRCEQWQRENGQFIPYPASYLRARQWEDDNDSREKRAVDDEVERELKAAQAFKV